MSLDKELFRHQIEVAAKRKKAALVIKHAKVMDVFNQEWLDADVAVENGQIVGIESTRENRSWMQQVKC